MKISVNPTSPLYIIFPSYLKFGLYYVEDIVQTNNISDDKKQVYEQRLQSKDNNSLKNKSTSD